MVWQLEQGPVTLAEVMPGINRIKERISPIMAENASTLPKCALWLFKTLHPLPVAKTT